MVLLFSAHTKSEEYTEVALAILEDGDLWIGATCTLVDEESLAKFCLRTPIRAREIGSEGVSAMCFDSVFREFLLLCRGMMYHKIGADCPGTSERLVQGRKIERSSGHHQLVRGRSPSEGKKCLALVTRQHFFPSLLPAQKSCQMSLASP